MTITCSIPCGDTSSCTQLIQVQREPVAKNVINEVTKDTGTWTTVSQFYGSVETGGGREVYRAQKVSSEVSCVVKAAWGSVTAAVTPNHRFVINGTVYGIIYCENVDEMNQTMRFGCRARKS